MSLVVVTLFDHPDKANQGMRVLEDAGFDQSKIETIESDPESQSFFKRIFSGEGRGEEMEAKQTKEFMLNLGIPEDNADHYATKVRKGHSLVIVRCKDEKEAERARQLFTRKGEEDFGDKMKKRVGIGGREEVDVESSREQAATTSSGASKMEAVEEELRVGKREVETGGVRAEKTVEEIDVEEQIDLKEEHLDIDRQDVDRPLREGEKAFEEEAIEVSETREEAVVNKTPKVREEVVISKDVEEHPETIKETVRREKINIKDLTRGQTGARFSQFEPEYRHHFEENFEDSGYNFDEYSDGYRYGMALAETDEYRGQDWEIIEPEARQEWNSQHSTPWNDITESVRFGWNKIRGDEEAERRPTNR